MLVDALIDEDPLLTRRRHREALIQLLTRLYDLEAADPAEAAEPEEEASDALQGVSVVLTGLTGTQQAFNGEIGTVVKSKGDKQKYEVDVKGAGQAAGGALKMPCFGSQKL